MEKYNIYITKFKKALGILFGVILLFIILLAKIIPQFSNIASIQENYKTTSSTLVDEERRLADLKASKEKADENEKNVIKEFFKPVNGAGLDTEAIISDEFGEILQLMRENKIKARSFKYEYDPNDDNFVKYVGNKYHVCRVSADMVATYSQFENFMRDLFKHEHFLEISTVEVTPYQKNKRILLINLKIKLYAQRDPNSIMPPAPVQNEENNAGEKAQNQGENQGNTQPPDIPQGESSM